MEADTNLTENAIRPTSVGKKNWMSMGGEDTGGRSAVIYTILESAKLQGHDPGVSLKDVLGSLLGMKGGELDALLPVNWQPAGWAAASEQIAGLRPVDVNGCPVERLLQGK